MIFNITIFKTVDGEVSNDRRQTAAEAVMHYYIDKGVRGLNQQESCAIAKMTAQCALYMGALKIFGTS